MAGSSSPGTCQAKESGRAGTSVRLEDLSLQERWGTAGKLVPDEQIWGFHQHRPEEGPKLLPGRVQLQTKCPPSPRAQVFDLSH